MHFLIITLGIILRMFSQTAQIEWLPYVVCLGSAIRI